MPTVQAIARHYDSLDQFYREIWGEHVHHGLWRTGRESPEEAAAAMSRHVLGHLELGPGARLADIGCGYGATARLAAEEYGARVMGMTVSLAQKQYADRQPVRRGAVEIALQDWAEMNFPAGTFDGAFALESLEHIEDKAGLAGKMRRALKPGGRFVAATWLRADSVPAWAERHLLEPLGRDAHLPPLVTAGGLAATLRQAGFPEVRIEDLSQNVARTWKFVLRRLARGLITRQDYRRTLFQGEASDRRFALAAVRIWLAYRTGHFRYGVFICR